MLTEIRHELAALDAGPKALRSFGLVVGTVLLGIAAFILWRSGWDPGLFTILLALFGLKLVVLGLAAPRLLKTVHRWWMALALVLGYVMTRVLLTLVFYLVVTPIGLLMRLVGRDPLERRIDRRAASYWKPKTYDHEGPERLEKYY